MKTKEPDSMINLVVHGNTPSKKNQRISLVIKGRAINIPSNKYREWHKQALGQLKMALKGSPRLEKVRAVHLCFYSENKRKFDLSNKAESIMDLLVDAKVLLDDNYEVVPELCLTYGGVSKEYPRCEITIYVI